MTVYVLYYVLVLIPVWNLTAVLRTVLSNYMLVFFCRRQLAAYTHLCHGDVLRTVTTNRSLGPHQAQGDLKKLGGIAKQGQTCVHYLK